jgi:hypothetical protein
MNKKRLVMILALAAILLIVFSTFFLQNPLSKNQHITEVTPVPSLFIHPSVSISSKSTLQIIHVTPTDGSIDVPANQQIAITFNRAFSLEEITFALTPAVSYSSFIVGDTLEIVPKTALSPGTYYFSIKYADGILSQTYSFTLVGTPSETQANTDTIHKSNEDWSRQFQPDLFLYNNTPYTMSTFSITGDITQSPNEHFFFLVHITSSDTNQAKQDLFSWLSSLGLKDKQIQSLDIRYQ